MYNRNVPEVPTINWEKAIQKIEATICKLDDEEREDIKDILLYHGCEPSVAADRIAEMLNTDRDRIIQLL